MRATWVGLAGFASGCFMAGNYHSAKTLEKGTSQFGMTFSATRYQKVTYDSATMMETNRTYAAIPNLFPELTYHIGVSDNVEAGGRIALGALGGELDVKWRFLRSDKLHLAIAPALGYQAFVIVEGSSFRLPAILTYELADNLDFTAAVFGSETHFSAVEALSEYSLFNGTLTSTGAAFGIDLHSETFTIRPAVEFTRYVYATSDSSFSPFNTVNILVHFAWIGGREKKQLDRIERKIDNLQMQQNPPPPGSYYPQQPPPLPPSQPPPPPPAAPEPPPQS